MDRYVYVISKNERMVKIGISHYPEIRRKGLETETGEPMTLEQTWVRPKEEAIKVERRAHKLLRSCRTLGEWFACTKEEAIEAVERALVPVPEKPPAPQRSPKTGRTIVNIKGFSKRSWEAGRAAAKARNVTMGIWISDAIDALADKEDATYAAQEALKAASPRPR